MASKSLPVSVRISEQDAQFIANLKIKDALTSSDKIRAIIGAARERYERSNDYKGQFRNAQDLMGPAMEVIKSQECDATVHSQLLSLVVDWLTETVAFLTASTVPTDEKPINLGTLEKGIAQRAFRLIEAVMRMGITKEAPCYDKNLIKNNLSPVLELAEIIVKQQEDI